VTTPAATSTTDQSRQNGGTPPPPAPAPPGPGAPPAGPLLGRGWTATLIVVRIVLFAGAALYTGLQAKIDNLPDAEWARTVTVWDGVIAFISYVIGALLGVAVTIPRINDAKQQTKSAEDDKKKAQAQADTNAKDAKDADHRVAAASAHVSLGRALAKQVKAAIQHDETGPSTHLNYRLPDGARIRDLGPLLAGHEDDARELGEPVSPSLKLLGPVADEVLSLDPARPAAVV
jgi:hypothetical protein